MNIIRPLPEDVAKEACSDRDTAQAAAFIVSSLPDRTDRSIAFAHLAETRLCRAPTENLDRDTHRDLVRMPVRSLGKKVITRARAKALREPKLDI